MLLDVDAKNDPRRVRVKGELNIYSAPDLKRELLDQLAAGSELEIDLSGIDELDTAGVQVLSLARREALGAGKILRVVAASAAVKQVFDRYNITAWFVDDDSAIGKTPA